MNNRTSAKVAKIKIAPESDDEGYAKISIIMNNGIRSAPAKVNRVAAFFTKS